MATEAEFIPIQDMDDWDIFWANNADALEDEIGDEATCMRLAMNCCLMIGGGASPLLRVGFVD